MTRRPPTSLNQKEISQIKVMKASGLTHFAISQKINRDPKTVKSCCLKPEIAVEIEEMKQDLADMFEDMARQLIASISYDDILKINAYQRMVSAGIATDKMRLLRNESTTNVSIENINLSKEETEKQIIELEEEMSAITGIDYQEERIKLREKVLREKGKR